MTWAEQELEKKCQNIRLTHLHFSSHEKLVENEVGLLKVENDVL